MAFAGRRVFVTGGAKRIGASLAEALAAGGADIAVHYFRSQGDAKKLCADLSRRYGGNYLAVHADLTRPDALNAAMRAAKSALGDIDAVILNASCFQRDDAASPSLDIFRAAMETNVFAASRLINLLAENDRARTDAVIISDYISEIYSDAFFSYGLSRAALDYATKALALRHAPHMRVNAIALGNALPAPTQRQSHFDAQYKDSPLAIATPLKDIENAMRFIFSCDSLTGHTLFLDSGKRLARAPYLPD